jgi:hypothetical protein
MSFDATGFGLVLLIRKKIEGIALWNRKTSGGTFQQFVANLGFSVNRLYHTKRKIRYGSLVSRASRRALRFSR